MEVTSLQRTLEASSMVYPYSTTAFYSQRVDGLSTVGKVSSPNVSILKRCTAVYKYICTHMYVGICTYVHTHVHTCTYVYVHTYRTHTYICMYIHMYLCHASVICTWFRFGQIPCEVISRCVVFYSPRSFGMT